MSLISQMMRGLRPAVAARRAIRGPRLPSWSIELETVAEVLRQGSFVGPIMPLGLHRRILDPKRPTTDAMRKTKIHWYEVEGIRCVELSRDDTDHDKVIIYLHGGAYSAGSLNSHHDLVARLCGDSGMRVVFPLYRLAPEHPFPAQLEDAQTVYRDLIAQGIDPANIIVAGDSAGGGLSLSLMYALRDAGDPLPAGVVLISAWLDVDSDTESMRNNARYDYVTRPALVAFAKHFAPRRRWREPLVSPLHGDPTGLPPMLIQVGGAEGLHDDNVALADKAASVGVDVELRVWPEMIHVWHAFAPFLKDGRAAIAQIAEFARQRVGAETGSLALTDVRH